MGSLSLKDSGPPPMPPTSAPPTKWDRGLSKWDRGLFRACLSHLRSGISEGISPEGASWFWDIALGPKYWPSGVMVIPGKGLYCPLV